AGPHGERLRGLPDQGLVAPPAVVVVEQAADADHAVRRTTLLGGLPHRRLGGRLVAVPRPPAPAPGGPLMAPPRPPHPPPPPAPADKPNERAPGTVRRPDQQPGRAVLAPVPVVLAAADPAIPIALRHSSRR